ncbi:hypothetical protein SAMN05444161_7819 [Rhizobiales bacterium GAS191]|nr:hypothetical protein SAMN05519103_07110 [Rhizobiales bacterium GAS113]SED49664.1 hypothetical protein SAMN05519104_3670 [Rhizobiales bacterium GAS188]SEE91567.1 hypothetical protein SAMN05444161_7819 [Rhizobiales bacterium GAS191]
MKVGATSRRFAINRYFFAPNGRPVVPLVAPMLSAGAATALGLSFLGFFASRVLRF